MAVRLSPVLHRRRAGGFSHEHHRSTGHADANAEAQAKPER
jgi:hypothetical protein